MLPTVVKNLLIINGLFFLAKYSVPLLGVDINHYLSLYNVLSPNFMPHQVVTHMFMHGGFFHLLFNMYALWLFGTSLENVWGPKRFLIFYMVCGLGAALLYLGVDFATTYPMYQEAVAAGIPINELANIDMRTSSGVSKINELAREYDPNNDFIESLYIKLITPAVGASGAVFGVLLAFGMLFPNTRLMLIFIPVPIKAKYFVIFYGIVELALGIGSVSGNWSDNVAHFAHVGGMLFGFILIKLWQRNRNSFY